MLLHGVDVGRSAVVRNAILDKNVVIGAGRADRRRPGGRPRALHRLAGRHRRDRQGREGRGLTLKRRAAHAGVPARGLRRRRRARRVPRARARARSSTSTVHCWGDEREPRRGRPRGPGLPALGRARRRRRRTLAALEAVSIDLAMAPRRRGRGARAQPHLVRQLRRPSGQAAVRHPARRDGAQPGAAAAVEGGAARRRLRALQLLRADGARGGRRDHRRLGASRRATSLACYPAIDPGAHQRHPQRHRRRASTGPTRAPTCSLRYGIDPERPSVVFVGRITRQKGVAYLLDAALRLRPGARSSCSARARRTRRRSRRRSRARVARVRERARRHRLDRQHAAARRGRCRS